MLIVESGGERGENLRGPTIVAAVERRKITVAARGGIEHDERCGDRRGTRRQPCGRNDPRRDKQGENDVRRQVKDVGVADVIAVGEQQIRGEQQRHQ
jgi:hypothetical protein